MNNLLEWENEAVIDGVLAEFAKLAEIPRPSGHEKAVSDYLYGAFEALGCEVEQDSVNNIIADLPATAGWEDKPLVALQAHMDMVCVADEGVEYNPLTDPIKLVREGDFLTADGTSLGADDGMGIAIILYIMKNLNSHGPLRAIITVDEESGMTGACNLRVEHFKDVTYLINCDSEDWDLLTVGSAGSGDMTFTKKYTLEEAPEGTKIYELTLSGLRGGHSGTEINCGCANAIKAMAMCLDYLRNQLPGFRLIGVHGGKAKNVIPGKAVAAFAISAAADEVQMRVDVAFGKFQAIYGNVEEQASLVLQELEDWNMVMDETSGTSLLDLLVCMPNGVSAMSQLCPGLVESSSNMGLVECNHETGKMKLLCMPRSSKEESIKEYYALSEVLARKLGFQLEKGVIFPGWSERKNSKLAAIMLEVFEEQNGQPMRMETIHAGLECSWHLQRNPDMDVVSIGTNNKDIHSPQETLELHTIVPQVQLIAETLQRI